LAALGLLLVGDVPNQPPPETVPGTLLGSPLTIATSRRAQDDPPAGLTGGDWSQIRGAVEASEYHRPGAGVK